MCLRLWSCLSFLKFKPSHLHNKYNYNSNYLVYTTINFLRYIFQIRYSFSYVYVMFITSLFFNSSIILFFCVHSFSIIVVVDSISIYVISFIIKFYPVLFFFLSPYYILHYFTSLNNIMLFLMPNMMSAIRFLGPFAHNSVFNRMLFRAITFPAIIEIATFSFGCLDVRLN